jgi:hypothetical protein
MFASQNRARVMQIRFQLTNTRKKDLSAAEYFNRVKALADSMASIGSPLKDDEVLGYMLAGLGPEYEPLVASLTTRDDAVSLNNFGTELCLEQQAPRVTSTPPPTPLHITRMATAVLLAAGRSREARTAKEVVARAVAAQASSSSSDATATAASSVVTAPSARSAPSTATTPFVAVSVSTMRSSRRTTATVATGLATPPRLVLAPTPSTPTGTWTPAPPTT